MILNLDLWRSCTGEIPAILKDFTINDPFEKSIIKHRGSQIGYGRNGTMGKIETNGQSLISQQISVYLKRISFKPN